MEVQIGGNPHNKREALSGPTLVIPELGPEMHIASMSLMVQPDKSVNESFFVLCARKGFHFGLESEVAQEKVYNFLKEMRPFTLGVADMVNGLWKESSKPADKVAMDEEFQANLENGAKFRFDRSVKVVNQEAKLPSDVREIVVPDTKDDWRSSAGKG